ncbi:EpsG family protein [uncultured Treponema sp.]|uniref:EpsG family protein n=1 Tax=uncultured Treponema sp. TaxID=162155 RepID=UPI0025FFE2D6|nr:EpsG family protein [uncultured Treponema sp.]
MTISSFKKNRSIDFLLLLTLFCFLWILFAFNTENPDRENYVTFYKTLKKISYWSGLEPGFVLFIKLCHKLNFSYQNFLTLYSFLGLSFLFNFILRYSKKPVTVATLFVLYPYFFQIVQIRFFFASCISIWGFHFLIDKKKWHNLKFIFTILCACLFHISSLMYFLFLLGNFKYRKILKGIVFIVISILLVEFVGFSIMKKFIPKLSHYLNGIGGTRFATKLFFIIYYFMKIHISMFLKKRIPEKDSFSDFSIKASLISVCFFPLICQSMDFQRLEQTSIILFYILAINQFSYRKNVYKRNTNFHLAEYYATIFYLFITIFILEFAFSFGQVRQIFLNNNFWSVIL